MSVKVHEPVCEDSAQDLYIWWDHFLGDQLKDEWRSTGDAGGSAAVIDSQTGGIVRITTNNVDGEDWRIDWNNIRSLLVSKKVTMECRLKLAQTTDCVSRALLFFDFDGMIGFIYASDAIPNWRILTDDGGAGTVLDSGIAADTDYHIFRIECLPTGAVHFYIDGVETANSPITITIPTEHLQPFLRMDTLANAAKSMDVDYVVARQER